MAPKENQHKVDSESSWNKWPWGLLYWLGFMPPLFWITEVHYDEDGFRWGAILLGVIILFWRFICAMNREDRDALIRKKKTDKKAKIAARKQEKKRAKEQAIEQARKQEQKALENSQKPKLSALEAAKLAISIVETMRLEELKPIIQILKSKEEVAEVLQNANNELIGLYSEKIEVIYTAHGILSSSPYYDIQLKTDLDRCMSLGMNSIELKLGLEGVADKISGKKIEKTKKWKEIQEDLK